MESARIWKFRSEKSSSDAPPDPQWLERLIRETGLSRVVLEVCWNRGLREVEAIRTFLSPRLDRLKEPLLIQDMSRAVERLVQARAEGECVRIYGDYDVDGTSGAALLSWFFESCELNFDALQPDRFKDGYGLGVAAVEQAAEDGVQCLVTVDCGITSFEAIECAQALGIDVIVVDHHQVDPARGIPNAHAVLDPQRPDCPSGLKELCGCGMAFYLCRALRTRGKELGWWPSGQEPNLKQHLDLVVLATAADMVPLTGDNHILVRQGLAVLKHTQKPGLRALCEVAGIFSGRELTASHLGFALGPRINASGRLGSASIALELLTTRDEPRAKELAEMLEKMNTERMELQNTIWDQVREQAEAGIAAGRFSHGIVLADERWHEGVVGIVASRVTESFQRPAVILSIRAEEQKAKGSVRSFGGKDVLQALRGASEHLLSFGGHAHAAGLSLSVTQIDAFALAWNQALAALPDDPVQRPLWIEGQCTLTELDPKTLEALESLGPFGPGNPEPLFRMRAQVTDFKILKERHLKLSFGACEAIWFNAAENTQILDSVQRGFEGEWVGVPELNRFRGQAKPSFRIRDAKSFTV